MKRNLLWGNLFYMLVALLCATSCEREISVDYRHVPPKLVMNGIITPDSIVFILEKTVDVPTPTDAKVDVIDAQLRVIGDDGSQYILTRKPLESNRFVALDALNHMVGGVYGVKYTVSATVGEEVIQGVSTLSAPVEIENLKFEWVDLVGDNQSLFLTFDWLDSPNEENYYHFLIKRENGDAYGWSIRSDEGEDGNRIYALQHCMSSEDSAEDEPDDFITDGETLIVEMRQIDRETYYYLMSLMVGENSSSNPIPFYTDEDYLGYFEACTPLRYSITYHENRVE